MLAAARRNLSAGLKILTAHHVAGDREPVGRQGRPVPAVQVRAAEVKLTSDAGVVQANLPVGLEPLAAKHGIGDGEPVGGQSRAVPAVQVRAAEVELTPDAGAD